MFYSHRIEIEIFGSYTPDNTTPVRIIKVKSNMKTFCCQVSTALMSAVGWTPISDSVKESLLNGTPIGLIRVENAPDLGNGRTRRNLGLWHTNGLHQLWCKSHKCYRPTADCTCRLCNDRHVDKWHLQTCAWLINDDISFTVSLTTINQLCQTLYATNPNI